MREVSHIETRGKMVPDRRNWKYEGPEVRGRKKKIWVEGEYEKRDREYTRSERGLSPNYMGHGRSGLRFETFILSSVGIRELL